MFLGFSVLNYKESWRVSALKIICRDGLLCKYNTEVVGYNPEKGTVASICWSSSFVLPYFGGLLGK